MHLNNATSYTQVIATLFLKLQNQQQQNFVLFDAYFVCLGWAWLIAVLLITRLKEGDEQWMQELSACLFFKFPRTYEIWHSFLAVVK